MCVAALPIVLKDEVTQAFLRAFTSSKDKEIVDRQVPESASNQ